MTEQERQRRIVAGYLWEDTEEYIAHQAWVKNLMYDFNTSRPSEVDKRRALMKQMFGEVGENVWINQPLTLAVGSTVRIGEGTYINSGLILIDDYEITIGKDCLFGTGVTLCTTGHPIDPEERAKGGCIPSRSPSRTAPGSALGRSCCPGSPSAGTRSSARAAW